MAKSKVYELALKIAGKVDGSLKSACTEAEKNLNTLGTAAQKAGKVAATALAAVGTAAAGVAASSLATYTDFEQAMANTAAIAGATGADYEALEAAARDMGAKTTKSATEAAEALGYMALAGWDTQTSISGLEPVLRLSEATQMDLATASDLVTDSMSALGLGVEELQGYLDLCVQTNNKANTTSQALMEAFIGCGGAAKTTGVDLTDLSTALGVLANNGTKGAEAGTALNSMLVRMTSKDAAIKAMDKLGVSAFDAQGNFRGLETVLTDLSGAMANLSTEEKASYMASIAGTNYYTEMSYLLDAVAESADGTASAWATLEGQLQGSDGALMNMAGQVTNTLQGAKDIFMSAVQEAQLTIGEQIAPYAQEGLSYLANEVLPVVTEKVGEIVPKLIEGAKWLWENKTAILAIGGAVLTAVGAFKGLKVATAAVGAVKNLSTIFKAASTSGGLLSKVLGMGNVKLAIIAGVIAAVAAGFVLLWNKSEKFRETVKGLLAQVQKLGGSLLNMASAIWSKVAPILEKVGTILLDGLARTVELLAPVIDNILGILSGIADFITGVFNGDMDQALGGLQDVFSNAMEGLGNLALAGFTAIMEIGTYIWPIIDKAVSDALTKISARFPVLGAVLSSLWSTVQTVWGNIQNILQNAIEFVSNVFSGNWSAAWQNVVNIFGSIFSTVATIAMAPINALSNGIQAAIDAVGAFLQEKVPFLGAIFTGWGATISAAIDNIKAVFSNIIDFISNVFSGNWSAAWQNITDIFGNIFGAVVNLAKAPINGVISAINFVLEKINGISVTIPDWVPGVGGKTLGFNIPTIPQLATGGIVTAPTILQAGEGGEPEAILPLSKLGELLAKWTNNLPAMPDIDTGEEPAEAPLAKLAATVDRITRRGNPEPSGSDGGPAPEQDTGGGGNPQPQDRETIMFSPVFNFYGGTPSKEEAVEAGRLSFAEFKRLYDRMEADKRRKQFSPA